MSVQHYLIDVREVVQDGSDEGKDMSWGWLPILPATVAVVGMAVSYNAPARLRAEVLECRAIISGYSVDDHRKLDLQSYSDKRFTNYVWQTVHAPAYRRHAYVAWILVILTSACLSYTWLTPPPESTPAWIHPCSVALWAVALLVWVWAIPAACRQAARKRADFERNIKGQGRVSDGDGPRRPHR